MNIQIFLKNKYADVKCHNNNNIINNSVKLFINTKKNAKYLK
jgi:hypothetical protein